MLQVNQTRFHSLQEGFRGQILVPGDPGYDDARRVWNGMIDRRPAVIARCADVEDVIRSVRCARENDLTLAVRGGGHSFPGHSVCDDGLMIDLSLMKGIEVDVASRQARAEPGVLWGEFDQATQAHGLATTGGQISHTGIAGLTLGGGIGWLMRRFGATCDNLLSAQVVTADGQLLTASPDENEDLFWGLRGGGGNFGIVTSFQYQLHPVGPMVYGGLVAYPLPQAPSVLGSLGDLLTDAPDELAVTAALMTTPDGHQALGIAICYAGDPEQGALAAAPLGKLGTVVMEQVGPMPYVAVQSMLDQVAEPGRRYYLRSNFLSSLDHGAIDLLATHYARTPSPFSTVILVQMGGAISRVDPQATAFFHRDPAYSFSAFACWTDPAEDDVNIRWTRDLHEALGPFAARGVYVNELVDEGVERIRAAYGSSYDRLAALKKKYDPENLFRLNQNIRPE